MRAILRRRRFYLRQYTIWRVTARQWAFTRCVYAYDASFWTWVNKVKLFFAVVFEVELTFYMSDVDCGEQAIFGQKVSVGFADHFFYLLDFLTTHTEMIKPAVFPQHFVYWA